MKQSFHICALTNQPPDIKRFTFVNENNPQCREYFRSRALVLEEKRKQLKSPYPCLIHPFSIFRTYFELWMCIVFFASLFFKPFIVTFHYTEAVHTLPTHYFNLALNICGIFNVFLTFITGYAISSSKVVVMEPKRIAKHYIFSIYFIADILSAIPYDIVTSSSTYNIRRALGLLYLMKFVRAPTLILFIRHTAEYFRIRPTFIRIFICITILALAVHWTSCIMFLVPQIRHFMAGTVEKESWIYSSGLMKGFPMEDYTLTLFRAACLMLGIHAGVYNVQNWEELVLDIIIAVIGKIFILTFTVIILQICVASRSLETKYQMIISQLMEYMRYKGLPSKLQERILQLYNYKYSKKYFKESATLTLLSDTLIKEMNLHICKKLIQNVPLFAGLPEHIIGDLLVLLKLEIYLPNDYIIKAGTVGDCMYFLASGTVSVSTPSGKEICHLQDGAHFGEISLIFSDKNRIATVCAIEICEVYCLDRKSFKSCFSTNPELYRKLEEEAKVRQDSTHELEEEYKKLLFEKSYIHPKTS